jgi:anion-transporting  ArsA/GET3 family ATPase
MTAPRSLTELIETQSIVVCCGSGGVGKTTTAAALAIRGAELGRRVVVVTIDPAKRLADALGLGGTGLSNQPQPVAGPWSGQLDAMMLDTKQTFDDLVTRYASGPEQAAKIHANTFYRNISGSLGGTQEYMAAEKLFQLVEEAAYDLVVIDTPPSRNALDFLDAPERLSSFLNHRLYRVLMAPTRLSMRVLNLAAQTFFRQITKVVGSSVIDDAISFFEAFDGMEDGFRDRATRTQELLQSTVTVFVLITSPRGDTVAEAEYFASELRRRGNDVAALVVNRMLPAYAAVKSGPAALRRNVEQFRAAAAREEANLVPLIRACKNATVVRVPLLAGDVQDLESLHAVGDYLFR